MTAYSTISGLPAATTLLGTELVEVSQLSTTVLISAATISAAAADNSYNDSGSGFVTAGFAVGDRVKVTGFTGNAANNILVGVVTSLTAGKMETTMMARITSLKFFWTTSRPPNHCPARRKRRTQVTPPTTLVP